MQRLKVDMATELPQPPETFHGACMCGAVHYFVTARPLACMICHCDRCRPQSGSAFSTVVLVPRRAFAVTGGETAAFRDIGESGKRVLRCFCAHCGSPVLTDCEALPDSMIIKAGTIHANEWFAPSMEIFVRRRRHWLQPVPGAAQFAGNPPL